MPKTSYIALMAKAAAYEEEYLKRDSIARRYYKQDYVGVQQLKARVWATIFYIIYWAYKVVDIFYIQQANLLHYNYTGLIIRVLAEYAVVLIAVSVIAGLVHSVRCDRAKKRLDVYYVLLDQIDNFV